MKSTFRNLSMFLPAAIALVVIGASTTHAAEPATGPVDATSASSSALHIQSILQPPKGFDQFGGPLATTSLDLTNSTGTSATSPSQGYADVGRAGVVNLISLPRGTMTFTRSGVLFSGKITQGIDVGRLRLQGANTHILTIDHLQPSLTQPAATGSPDDSAKPQFHPIDATAPAN